VAIIAAAGSSRRMGDGLKKEFRQLHGTPVLVSAIRPFLAEPRCSRVIVMLPEESLAEAEGILEPHLPLDRLAMLPGGATRQESVWRGLVALAGEPPEIVLIHDGARPWLSAALVSRVLEGTARWGACVPAVEAHEAVKEVGADAVIVRHLPRASIRVAQTPQGFRYTQILEAHERARRAGLAFVDDAEVYARFEGPVAWIEGDAANAKITWQADLERS
jgi:2-C-methyl-D-erythritol 4-phosphate cytidylyltransferase